jgi:hypothetical protein
MWSRSERDGRERSSRNNSKTNRAGNTRLSEHHTPQRPGLYGWYRPGAFSGEWRFWIGDNNPRLSALQMAGLIFVCLKSSVFLPVFARDKLCFSIICPVEEELDVETRHAASHCKH